MPSELRVDKVSSTTSPYDPVFSTTGGALSHRNMIINGAMQIFQRCSSAAIAAGNPTYDTADRWRMRENTDGAYTSRKYNMSLAEINTTGHASALQLNCTTADTSIASGQYAYVATTVEAQNCQHLQYGTASAKTLTLSFWVKSNKTGTYTISVRKQDTTQYVLPIEYTISAADTWEKKTINISPTAGSTSLITSAAGVITNDTGEGLQIGWSLVWGSDYNGTNNTWSASSVYSTTNQVNWMDSTSNNFYLTGVQLELGTVATPFEQKSFHEELLRCQRYFINYGINDAGGFAVTPESGTSFRHTTPGAANTITANACFANVDLPVRMRVSNPTFTAGRAFNGSGSNLSNTNWAPFVNVGNAQQICLQKKTDDMTTNQTVIILSFSVDAELGI